MKATHQKYATAIPDDAITELCGKCGQELELTVRRVNCQTKKRKHDGAKYSHG